MISAFLFADDVIASSPGWMRRVIRTPEGDYHITPNAREIIVRAVKEVEDNDYMHLARIAGGSVEEAQQALKVLRLKMTGSTFEDMIKHAAAAALLILITKRNDDNSQLSS